MAPAKSKKLRDKKRATWTKDIKRRDELKQELVLMHESGQEVDNKVICKYRKQRNHCNRIIKKKILDDTGADISETSDLKDIWKKINIVLKPEREAVNEIKLDTGTKMLTDSKEIAQEFNKFFKNKVTTLASKIKPDKTVDPLEKLREKVKNMRLSFKLKT